MFRFLICLGFTLLGALVTSSSAAQDNAAQEATVPQNATAANADAGIAWDQSTLRLVQAGATYGRMVRLRDKGILCAFDRGGQTMVKASADEGKTWREAVLVARIEGAIATNPELLALQNGRVLLFFNRRPHTPGMRFAIEMRWSDDKGTTWQAPARPIYEAGSDGGVGCWEPAALQLPNGEIQLFFANEAPFPNNNDQEISLQRSFNNGATWSAPQTVSYRAGHRDGMPVPLLLQNRDIALAIEDSGVTSDGQMKPVIARTSLLEGWRGAFVDARSPRRDVAVGAPWPGEHTYAGAPYLRQMANGATVLSSQVNVVGKGQSQMWVWVGDSAARNFARPSQPFARAGAAAQVWNALFVKNAATITAIGETEIDGQRGLWSIDGHLRAPNTAP